MSHQLEQTNPDPVLGNRYRLISQLGAGGFGQTFLAEDLHLPGCPRCVVKRLFAQTTDPKRLQTARRLFDTEAKVLYQLGSHEQIPSLFAHFEESQEFYLVQEFIEGESLSQQLARGEAWSEEQVIALVQDILQVLSFVHQQHVIHRDIKPSNLMRRRKDGRIVLIDFGAVKQVSVESADPTSAELTDSTVSIGTQGYIPNEQLAGRPRFSSDVYAVGITGIQALTGIHPKQLRENSHTGELEWHGYVPQTRPELVEVLDCMVRYDFRDRYPTAVEALIALQRISSDLSATALPPFAQPTELGSTLQVQPLVSVSGETRIDQERGAAPATPADETLTLVGNTVPVTSLQSPRPRLQNESSSDGAMKGIRSQLAPWLVLTTLAIVGTAALSLKVSELLQPANRPVEPPLSSLAKNSNPKPSPSKAPPPLSPKQQAEKLLSEANQLRKQRQYKEALATYDKVIKLRPGIAQAYWGRCESLNGLKRPAQAIVACDDALAVKPNYAEAVLGKGVAFKQQQRILEALDMFERATQLKPKLIDAWIAKGSTLQEVGRSAEAIAALDQAIALNRNSAEAWSIRGSALWNLGRFDQAVLSLDKALQIQPDAKTARTLRQQAREELGY